MSNNENLHRANAEKNDEFYTQLPDIENELWHYRDFFKGKTVFCNCDDPYESNFFKYFAMNFNSLGLKKLICTCYATSPVSLTQLSFLGNDYVVKRYDGKPAYKIEIAEVTDANGDGAVDLSDVEYLLQNDKNAFSILQGDGDFRSDECIELLKQADVVVTNPPFSLFREYVAQLVEYNKKFIIIGNQNAITYKEFFPLLKDNKVWLGFSCGGQTFQVPKDFSRNNTFVVNGVKYAKFGNICWFTNVDITKRHEEMQLFRNYSPELYPTYDNYDAINVDKTCDIPCDYYGVMGVPITFLDKYNPEQFEIIGCTEAGNSLCTKFYEDMYQHIDGKCFRNMKSARYAPMICHNSVPNQNYYTVSNADGFLTKCYFRIFIRRKQNESNGKEN